MDDKRWVMNLIVSFKYCDTFVLGQDSVYQSIPSKAYTPGYNRIPERGAVA